MGFPWGSTGKESTCNAGGLGSIPRLGRFSGDGKGYSRQYSGLENSMDCIVHGVERVRRLSDFHFRMQWVALLVPGGQRLQHDFQVLPGVGFRYVSVM